MVTVSVETELAPTDDTGLVRRALLKLFPDSDMPDAVSGDVFPTSMSSSVLCVSDVELTRLQERLQE